MPVSGFICMALCPFEALQSVQLNIHFFKKLGLL